MIPLTITMDNSKGITILSNVFIDQYMKNANDAQIKVYLYLLRMVGANLPTDISEMADIFNHTEKDIIRSLKYWESENLLSLSFDEKNNICGIALKDLTMQSSEASVLSNDTSVSFDNYLSADVLQDKKIPMISMDYKKEKASYSLEDLARLQSDPEAKMLLNASAMYFGRPLNANEIRTILFIYDRLAFSLELTDYLIEYCIDNDNASIHYIEQVAINWYEEGINSVDKAKQVSVKNVKAAYPIMKFLGKTSEPTSQEHEYVRRWTMTYSFALDIIEEACKRTVMATDKNRFQYADTILKNWHNKNVHSLKDIAILDEAFSSQKVAVKVSSAPKAPQAKVSGGSFCNIEKHDYDFDMLEKALTKR